MALNLVCAVLDRGPENLAEMAVLLALADGADKDTGETWPSQGRIAARSRQTPRSVRKVLERLRASGWVSWEKRLRPNGSQASNVYRLNLAMLGEGGRNHVPPPEPCSTPPRNHVPPPPEPRSTHGPEPRSTLEPSQKKETRARASASRAGARFASSRFETTRAPSPSVAPEVTAAGAALPAPAVRRALAASLGLPVFDPVAGCWRQGSASAEKIGRSCDVVA
jgi:hypothetical protein